MPAGGARGRGEMTERPNVAVLKTAVRLAYRGFESPSLRGEGAPAPASCVEIDVFGRDRR